MTISLTFREISPSNRSLSDHIPLLKLLPAPQFYILLILLPAIVIIPLPCFAVPRAAPCCHPIVTQSCACYAVLQGYVNTGSDENPTGYWIVRCVATLSSLLAMGLLLTRAAHQMRTRQALGLNLDNLSPPEPKRQLDHQVCSPLSFQKSGCMGTSLV